MRVLVALALLLGLASTASAATFRLECLDAYDGRTRLALIEVNLDAEAVRIYSESQRDWRSAVNVSIAEATISYVAQEHVDGGSVSTSVTIDRVTGKYVAYSGYSPRKDGTCRKIS